MVELNRKILNNFNLCFIIYLLTCVPLAINLPFETLYTQFLKDLSKENCELPPQIKLTNAHNFDDFGIYLDICNKADSVNSPQLMCKEIFDMMKYIFCFPKNITLPEINVKISEQVCTDIQDLKVSENDKDRYFINHLKDKIMCDLICVGPVTKACQILLWSYDVQQKIHIVHEALLKDQLTTIVPKDSSKQISSTTEDNAKPGKADQIDSSKQGSLTNEDNVKPGTANQIDSSKQGSLTNEDNAKPGTASQIDNGISVQDPGVVANSETTKESEHATKDQHTSEGNTDSRKTVEKVTASQDITEKKSEVNTVPLETSAINTNQENNLNQLEEQKGIYNQDQPQNQEDPHDDHPDDIDEHVEENGDNIGEENKLPAISTADEDAPHESPLHAEDKTDLTPNEVPGNIVNSKDDENQPKGTDVKVSHDMKPTQQTLVTSCTPQGDCTNVKVEIEDDLSIPLGKVGNDQVTPEEKTTDVQTIADLKTKTVEQANTAADVKTNNMDESKIPPLSDGDKYEGEPENDDDFEPDDDAANFPDSNSKVKEPSIPTRDEEEFSFNQERKKIAMMAAFPEQESGNFFFYFLSIVMILMAGYLVFHNKQKIIALIVEGRHERRRRSHGAGYKKLETK